MAVLLSLCFFAVSLFPSFAIAHGETGHGGESHSAETVAFGVPRSGLENAVASFSVKLAGTAAIIIVLLSFLAIITEGKTEKFKKILFWGMAGAIVLPTVFFAASTVYINTISDTGGPVHWHLDFRIFACGEEQILRGPEGLLSNKVGTPTFHHHDDNRIHVEGTVVDIEEVTLGSFFSVIGGKFTDDAFTIPEERGTRTYKNGDQCPSGVMGEWQAFLFEVPDPGDKNTRLTKLEHPSTYIMKPQSIIPPGDCVVFEFGPPMDVPTHTCTFYDIAYRTGKLDLPTLWTPPQIVE